MILAGGEGKPEEVGHWKTESLVYLIQMRGGYPAATFDRQIHDALLSG